MLRAQASACSPSALSTERPARFLKPKKRGPPIKGSPRDFRRWAWMISGTSLAAEVQSVLRPEILKGMRIPAGDVEALVLDRLRVFFSSRIDVSDAVAPLDLEAHSLDAALRNAFGLSERWLAAPPVEMRSLVREIVERVTVAADRIEIRLGRANVAAALEAEGASQRPDLDSITLSIEAKLRRAGKGKRLVIENGAKAEVNEGTNQRSFRDPKPRTCRMTERKSCFLGFAA
jgi:hypothetical protein